MGFKCFHLKQLERKFGLIKPNVFRSSDEDLWGKMDASSPHGLAHCQNTLPLYCFEISIDNFLEI